MKVLTLLRSNAVLGLFAVLIVAAASYAIFEWQHPTLIESDNHVPIRAANGGELVIKTD